MAGLKNKTTDLLMRILCETEFKVVQLLTNFKVIYLILIPMSLQGACLFWCMNYRN